VADPAEQWRAGDGTQPSLVPRYGYLPRLMPGVDMTADVKRGEQLFYVCLMLFLLVYRKSRSQ
jgi:hypothetical protein